MNLKRSSVSAAWLLPRLPQSLLARTRREMATETATAPSDASALTPELFRRLFPRPYLDRFVDEKVRPDGRPLARAHGDTGCRDVSINTGELSAIGPLVFRAQH